MLTILLYFMLFVFAGDFVFCIIEQLQSDCPDTFEGEAQTEPKQDDTNDDKEPENDVHLASSCSIVFVNLFYTSRIVSPRGTML